MIETKAPITIAVVDDYTRVRDFISRSLTESGFTVVCEANNGRELLSYLEQVHTLPMLCLLDINMPVMNGFDTAKHLKKHFPSIRILAYSSWDDRGTIEKILDCGAHGFIPKCSSLSEIETALVALLKNVNAMLLHL